MASCAIDTVRRVGKYLQTPVGTLSYNSDKIVTTVINKENIEGFASVIMRLVREKKVELSRAESLQVYQWLEFIASFADHLNKNLTLARNFMNELNSTFESISYVIGHTYTIADVVLYHTVYSLLESSSVSDREAWPHVCRWARHVQSHDDLRAGRQPLQLQAIFIQSSGRH